MTPKQRQRVLEMYVLYSNDHSKVLKNYIYFRENQDKERLLDDAGEPSGEMIPSSDFQIRNRYLCRIGAPVNIKEVSYLASEFSWYYVIINHIAY